MQEAVWGITVACHCKVQCWRAHTFVSVQEIHISTWDPNKFFGKACDTDW